MHDIGRWNQCRGVVTKQTVVAHTKKKSKINYDNFSSMFILLLHRVLYHDIGR